MKRTRIFVSCICAILFSTTNGLAQELYVHSNAASIDNEANSTDGWTTNSTVVVNSVQNEVHHGNYSLKVSAIAENWAVSSYSFDIEIGAVYNISIYAKSESSKTPGFFLWEGFEDFVPQSITSTNWTLYTFSLTATDSLAKIKVYTGNTYPAAIGDAAYIDYISIQKVTSDTQPPSAPTLSSTGQTDTTVDLSWSGATDNVGITGYQVYTYGSLTETLGNVNSYQVTGLTAGTTYAFTVRALDAASNESGDSNAEPVTTNASSGGSDTQSPSSPTLSSAGQTDTTVNLSWNGATDNIDVTGYKIFKDGVLETTLNNITTYQVTGLTAGNLYSFTATALDAAGNESVVSNAVSVTTDSSGGGSSGGGSSVWSEASSVASYTGDVAVGTSTVPTGYKMAIDGKLIAEEIKVQLSGNWPDYVFANDYDLPSLEEVQKHIEEQGHLPNIPSAKEVEKNGLEVGEMNRLLLEKIEELTLYVIELKNENQRTRKEAEEQIRKLETKINKLQNLN